MPDITMCESTECQKKDFCYRSTAKPSDFWQAWANFYKQEYQQDNGDCQYFIDNSEYKRGQL